MVVERIESTDSKKVKVIFEDGACIPLYKGELRKHSIKVGEELSEEVYNSLTKDILYKRAKERALYILERSDKTKKQIEDKLAGGSYPPAIIDRVVNFLERYGYIDDENFARSYIKTYSESRSLKVIEIKLMQKGVSRDIIKNVIEDFVEEDDYNPLPLIEEIVRRKRFDYENADYKERNKIVSHLLRKGFGYDDVMRVLKR